MTQDKRLSLAFGGLDCEIVGYDDPLDLLDRIVEILSKTSERRAWLNAGDGTAGNESRRGVAARLGENPDFSDAEISARDGRLTFTRREPADADPSLSYAMKAPPCLAAEFKTMRALLGESEAAAAKSLAARAGRPRVRVVRAAATKRHSSATADVQPDRRDNPHFGGGPAAEALPPTAFLRNAATGSIEDLLEAAAAWLVVSEGRMKFSRREVMVAFAAMERAGGVEEERGRDARQNAFRALLKSGAIERLDDGRYALSSATLLDYEARMLA